MRSTLVVIAFLAGYGVLLNVPFETKQPFFLLTLTGALCFGLSFIPAHAGEAGNAPRMSHTSSLFAIFYEPSRVFGQLRAHPSWLPAFLIIALCTAAYSVAFTRRVTPEVIAAATIDKTVEGGWITAEQARPLRDKQIKVAASTEAKIINPLAQVITNFVFVVVLAGLYLLGVTMFGGSMNFWQSLSVVVYASLPIFIIRNFVSLIVLYINEPDTIDPIKGQAGLVMDNLGALFSATAHPYLHAGGSLIGLLSIYGLWLMATGLRTTASKVSGGAAWAVTITIWCVGLLLTLVFAWLFPSFI